MITCDLDMITRDLDMIIVQSAVMTSQALISKINCMLLANQKRDRVQCIIINIIIMVHTFLYNNLRPMGT